MGKFTFSLQKLLDLKQFRENQRAIELGVAQTKLNKEKIKYDDLKEGKQNLFKTQSGKDINLTHVRSLHDYLLQMNSDILKQQKKINMAQKEVEEKRVILVKANQNKKSVELLKDKHQLNHKKTESREAMKIENEIALRSAGMKTI